MKNCHVITVTAAVAYANFLLGHIQVLALYSSEEEDWWTTPSPAVFLTPKSSQSKSTSCKKYGTNAEFNETVGKCVLTLRESCDETVVMQDGEVQCGSGLGDEAGICTGGECDCGPDKYVKFLEARKFLVVDYVCAPVRGLNENCADDAFSCQKNLYCDSLDRCACPGVWDAAGADGKGVCRNREYCRSQLVPEQAEDAYFDSLKTMECKCTLGVRCEAEAESGVSLCPINSTLRRTQADLGEIPVCECDPGLKAARPGWYCVEVRRYGEPCKLEGTVVECLGNSFCYEGRCQCAFEGMLDRWRWDPVMGSCVTRAGQYCEGLNCTANSVCVEPVGRPYDSRRCTCAKGYKVQQDGQCALSHGDKCTRENPTACPQGMECLDERCTCRDAVGQFYDPVSGQCLTLIGSPCDKFSTCAGFPGASCDKSSGKCECEMGLTPSENNARCFRGLSYGANCTANQCDHRLGLTCAENDGKCVCIDSALVYNNASGVCLAQVGTHCGEFELSGSCLPAASSGQPSACEYSVVACETGSECVEVDKKGAAKGSVCRADVSGTFVNAEGLNL